MPVKKKFDHKKVERKWQKKWEKEKINFPSNMLKAKKRFYNLWMFPYPSGEGLHAGHAFASTGSDIYGRYTRMNGKDVFQPIGFDSFGMHSENFALTIGEHPKKMLDRTIGNYARQMKELGHGYDWTRTVTTSEPDYYRWTQWLFVQMFKAGLAYRKKSTVNWCPSCKTVLADEQAMSPAQAGKEPKMIDGSKVKDKESVKICERCGYVVEKRDLEQWHFRITDYADKLLENLGKIDWPERIKTAQKNWIGRSEGVNFKHKVKDLDIEFEVYDSIPQTHRAQTFVVIAPEHPLVGELVKGTKYEKDVLDFVEKIKKKKLNKKFDIGKEMEGVFTGRYSENYLGTGIDLPIWVASFVIMDYGTGVVGCSAHDERDFRFAKKYGLPLKPVLFPKNKKLAEKVRNLEVFYREPDGILEEPEEFKGKRWDEVREPVIDYIEREELGRRVTNYHLRDWIISRQRYWGPPIPMVFCQKCADKGKSWFTESCHSGAKRSGARESYSKTTRSYRSAHASLQDDKLIHKNQSDWNHAGWFPEENLPVELPFVEDYKPKGTGRGPLDDHPEFYETKCPCCSGKAKRETDVSDTFLDSAWYFLRYPSVNREQDTGNSEQSKNGERRTENGKLPWDSEITKHWLPVNLYFGGAEHAVLHLMYARFVTMALHDMGHIDFEEPFTKFYAHGLMIKDGAKMSKSRGNVVNPDEYIEKYGADTLRLYLMFMGPMDGYPDFRDTGIEGMRRFIERVWQLCTNERVVASEDSKEVSTKLHQTIKKVTEDIQEFGYNTAIASIMELVNVMRVQKKISKKSVSVLTQLLAPFAPHITEQIWCEVLGEKFSVHKSLWPKYDPKYIKEDTVEIAIQVNGKLRSTIQVQSAKCKVQSEVVKLAKEDERVKKWISRKKVRKTIFIPGKLINFVV